MFGGWQPKPSNSENSTPPNFGSGAIPPSPNKFYINIQKMKDMTMNNEIKTLLTIYENKLSSLWQLEGQLMECDDTRYYSLESKAENLVIAVETARRDLINAIEELTVCS